MNGLPEKQFRVAFALYESGDPMSGLQVKAAAKGVSASAAYASLYALRDKGLAKSRKEAGNPTELGRPLRTYYVLTGLGQRVVRQQLEDYKSFVGNGAPA